VKGSNNRRAKSRRQKARTRPRVVELPRPAVTAGGRLRVVDFPPRLPPFSVETFPLRVEEFSDVIALPLVAGTRKSKSALGAVYDRTGDLVVESQRSTRRFSWGDDEMHLDDLPYERSEALPGRTLFAGRFVHHFGHILLETLSRTWPDIDYSVYDHLLLYPNRVLKRHILPIPKVLQILLTAAEIPLDKVKVISRTPLRIEQLDVPSAPFRLASSADPRFLVPFDRIGLRVESRDGPDLTAQRPARVYLSRSHLADDKRRATNEADLEELMVRRGFTVVHPQEHPLEDQAAMIRRADVIAGCDGSALHLAVFAHPGAKLLAIDTRAVENQFIIEQARELDAVHIWGATEKVPGRLAQWTADLPRIAFALDLLLDEPLESEGRETGGPETEDPETEGPETEGPETDGDVDPQPAGGQPAASGLA